MQASPGLCFPELDEYEGDEFGRDPWGAGFALDGGSCKLGGYRHLRDGSVEFWWRIEWVLYARKPFMLPWADVMNTQISTRLVILV